MDSLSLYDLLISKDRSIKYLTQITPGHLAGATYIINSQQIDVVEIEKFNGSMVIDIFDKILNAIILYNKTNNEEKLMEYLKKPLVFFYKPLKDDNLVIAYGIPKTDQWIKDISVTIDHVGINIRSLSENRRLRVILYGLKTHT